MITNIKDFNKKKIFEKKLIDFNLLNNLFIVNETVETDEKQDIIQLLENNKLELVTPSVFKSSLNLSKHKEMLSVYSDEELNEMKLYKLPGYNIGYGLKTINSDTDIVLVHNNEPTIKGIGKLLISSAIKNGGNTLDHFDVEPLNTIYSDMGFVEYSRDKYDPKYDEDGKFANKYGKLDVIYRRLNK